jgi:hypothetical protein
MDDVKRSDASGDRLDPGNPLDHELIHRLAELERRLRDTQAMATRAYEAHFEWPRVLAEVRAAADYERAYHGDPVISVRVATYNLGGVLIERAISSLLRQSYGRWECLVVGDALTDDTEERIAALKDSRIRFLNLSVRGPYPDDPRARWFVAGTAPMNAGAAAATGGWIAALDHDDEWHDDHLEVLLREAQRTKAEIVYGRIRVLNTETGEVGEMGAWPPVSGQFGFLGSLYHRGLNRIPYDLNARFADEPGDWNLARRLWEMGVRFQFLDRVVATSHYTPRHDSQSTEQRLIEELRRWSGQLVEARDYWRAQAESAQRELREAQMQIDAGSGAASRMHQSESSRD